MRGIYNQIFQKARNIWADFQKWVLADNLDVGVVIIFLPSASESALYKQRVADIKRLIEAGYLVKVISEQEQTPCGCNCRISDAYEVLSEIQRDLKTLKEHA